MIKKLLYIMLFINTLYANPITIENSKSLYENFELYYIEDTNNSFNIQTISKTKFILSLNEHFTKNGLINKTKV